MLTSWMYLTVPAVSDKKASCIVLVSVLWLWWGQCTVVQILFYQLLGQYRCSCHWRIPVHTTVEIWFLLKFSSAKALMPLTLETLTISLPAKFKTLSSVRCPRFSIFTICRTKITSYFSNNIVCSKERTYIAESSFWCILQTTLLPCRSNTSSLVK